MRDEETSDGDEDCAVDLDWPVEFRGVTESVVSTLGPNDLWNVAALGLHPPDSEGVSSTAESADEPVVTARTWGNTRTRRNFHRQGGGYVQFVRDPVTFVDAALSIYEVEAPVLDAADAWVEVDAERVDSGESGGTQWEEWELYPREAGVDGETVPTVNRGFNAVVEATVAASRLSVDAYNQSELKDRLAYFEEVGRNCGDDRVREALDRLSDYVGDDS
ncbi:DUF447 domain-containing protein [Halorussus rarus]|uniref:DUF447 domain-containing protein n=1 Tax=Halorussus TaxID=1070314 RepID=UPI000E20CDCB|nr:DUF447 domain-containing protein [Halorussus rarus]NHN59321.1 DUF447 family protein [Halorussus sp. JP-T4]